MVGISVLACNLESNLMYSKIRDIVTSIMVNNSYDIIVTVVAQPPWVTYLICVILMLIIINKSLDTPPLQLPNMKPTVMFFVNET